MVQCRIQCLRLVNTIVNPRAVEMRQMSWPDTCLLAWRYRTLRAKVSKFPRLWMLPLVSLLTAQDNRNTEKYSGMPPGGIRTHFGSFRVAEDSRGLRRRGLLSALEAVTVCNSIRGVPVSCDLLLSMSWLMTQWTDTSLYDAKFGANEETMKKIQ